MNTYYMDVEITRTFKVQVQAENAEAAEEKVQFEMTLTDYEAGEEYTDDVQLAYGLAWKEEGVP